MDASDEDVPYVFVDDEAEAPPPRRRRPWLWTIPAGILLLAALGGALLFHGPRPTSPVSAAVVPIAVAEVIPREEPPAPTEPAPEAPPALPPPTPLPVEIPVLVEDPITVVEEESAVPPPSVPAGHVTKVLPPVPSVPAPSDSFSIEKELDTAATAIGDAKPLLFEVVDNFDPPAFRNEDVRVLAAKMDRVEKKLRDAQAIYFRLKDCGADSEILDRRLETIRDLLGALREGRARIRVPLALRTAEGLQEEAAPLTKEALDGFQPSSHEAQALDVRAEVALGKLQEARRLYASIRNDVPDPELVDRCLKSIDARIDDLNARYPQVNAAH